MITFERLTARIGMTRKGGATVSGFISAALHPKRVSKGTTVTIMHLLTLALVQGITEFLPISSSGHLILVPVLTAWPDQGLLMDVAVHVGTLAAVVLYFWRDTRGIALAGFGSFGIAPARRAVEGTHYTTMFWCLVLATIPMVIVGGAMVAADTGDALRSPEVIATTSIIFGLLLYWADRRGSTEKGLEKLALKPALLIGLAQIFALIPGTSRSGVTMTAARALGFRRTEAARFSMLMSIPAILASGAVVTLKAIKEGDTALIPDAAIAAVLAFIAALIAIHFLMRWLARANMTIFVIYRVILGVALFGLIAAGVI